MILRQVEYGSLCIYRTIAVSGIIKNAQTHAYHTG